MNKILSQIEMIKTLFPSSFYYAPLRTKGIKKLNLDIADEAYKFRDIDDAGQEWCAKNYPGGYTSYSSIANIHQISSTFDQVRKDIDKHVAKYIRYLDMDINPKELKMTTFWINIMPNSVIHTMHIHPLSVISGTYYVKTPKNCGALKFEDPRMSCFMASPPRKADARLDNQRFYNLKPQAGNLVLFESWMRHEVCQNLGTEERISISFNYDWV